MNLRPPLIRRYPHFLQLRITPLNDATHKILHLLHFKFLHLLNPILDQVAVITSQASLPLLLLSIIDHPIIILLAVVNLYPQNF